MKKIIFIFLFLIIFSGSIIVYSRETKKTEEILEEIFPLRDDDGNFLGISCVITIPENEKEEKIKINPDIFGGINEYREMEVGSNIINLKIINKSKYDYVIDSFNISTKEIVDKNNYKNTGGIGFDEYEIYDVFSPYIVFNNALKNLFLDNGYEFSLNELEDKLKDRGYNGLEDIDKYYLDYYNKKYDLNCSKLDEFSSSIIKEIFEGEKTFYLEEDKEIIELAYNYFYKNILEFNFLDNNYKKIDILKGKAKNINGLKLNISDKYMTDAFKDYRYIGDISFTLNRS